MRRLWQRFMALSALSRASIVVGVIAVALLIAVLRPRPPEEPSRVVGPSPTEILPTVAPPPSSPPATAAASASAAPPTEARGGLAFKSPLDRKTMLARLNAAGPFTWTEREGHYRGEYLWAAVPPDAAVRIFSAGQPSGHYLADIKVVAREPGAPIGYERVEATVREKILPVVGATDVQKAASFD